MTIRDKIFKNMQKALFVFRTESKKYAERSGFSVKHLKKNMRKAMQTLHGAYRKRLNAQNSDPLSLWLTDNYYILEKSFTAAMLSVRDFSYDSRSGFAVTACREECPNGVLPDDDKLISSLLLQALSTAELQHLSFFLTYTLLLEAAEGLKNNETQTINTIRSIIKLRETDFGRILFEVSETEKILCQDPAGVYRNMDETTKDSYRAAVCRESQRSGKPEPVVAVDALEKAKQDGRHIGFYLPLKKTNTDWGALFLALEVLLPLIAGVILSVLCRKWYVWLLLYFPLWECLQFIPNRLSGAVTKPTPLPKMDYSAGCPDKEKTVIAVSMLLPSAEKAKECVPHLKDLCLSNCSDNTSICLLADLRSAATPTALSDKTDIKAMKRVVNKLNEQYDDKFILAVRPRVFSPTENEYTGFERKRGAITSLVKLITGDGNEFTVLHGDKNKLLGAKYIMALDSDTQMPLGALRQLIGTAAHPLNRPIVSMTAQRVTGGFGILSPRVETSVESANQTHFSSLMAGTGGLPAYSGASGEKYQDLFGESIFSGKGLIDVEAYRKLLPDRFPEQRVLSHDILEGMILRTGFVGETSLTDSFPSHIRAYFKRQHRWIRGDTQNLPFVVKFHKTLPSGRLPALGKWWLLDNIRRALTPAMALFALFLSLFLTRGTAIVVAAVSLLSAFLPDFLSCLATLIRGGVSMLSRLYFSDAAPYAMTCLLRAFVNIILLPENAFCALDAVSRSTFRLLFSKKHLLQWTTAADGEKGNQSATLLKHAVPSVLTGLFFLLFGNAIARIAGLFFLLDLPFSVFSAKKKKSRKGVLTDEERTKLLSYCAAMWKFYETYCTKSDNCLIPDNVQETPVYRVAHRTSPTNLGLMLCVFLAAADLSFISAQELLNLLTDTFLTISKLKKYKGHLYNWYDTRTLAVMSPAFVSAVDSGNFLCCLVALKEGLRDYQKECSAFGDIIRQCDALIAETEWDFLYDKRRNLFHIGYDCDANELTSSYFDLLMSEARMTSYFAVASGCVPVRHWQSLGRTLSQCGRYTGPVSWSGTMFEYFMPALFLPSVPNTLGSEALRFCIHCQKKRVKNMNLPYGISESGFYAFDRDLNYQYKAHGVNRLSLRNTPDTETVISPYSSFLTAQEDPHGAMRNLRKLEKLGLFGKYGFYEAADFTKSRTDGQDFAVVRSFMAHHVGMSFVGAVNALTDGVMQRRFLHDDAMAGGRSLLYEKIPSDAKVYPVEERRDRDDRPERIPKSKRDFSGIEPHAPNAQTLTNGVWSVFAADTGASVSVYGNTALFKRRYAPLSYPDGLFAAVRTPSGSILPFTAAPLFPKKSNASASFTETFLRYKNRDERFSCTETVTVHPRLPAQICEFTVRNRTKVKQKLSLMLYAEPLLNNLNERTAHPAFSDLFLQATFLPEDKIFCFLRQNEADKDDVFLTAGFLQPTDFRFTMNREAVLSRGEGLGSLFSLDFGDDSVSPDKCLAIEISLTLPPRASITKTLLLCASSEKTEAVNHLIALRKEGSPPAEKCAPSPFDPSGITGIYAKKVLERRLFGRSLPAEVRRSLTQNETSREELWETGVSGDFPVIVVFAEENDSACLPAFLQLHRKLRLCGLTTELVFLTNDREGYLDRLREEIIRCGGSMACDLIGKRGGIFPLNIHRLPERSRTALLSAATAVYPEKPEPPVQPGAPSPTILPAKRTANTGNLFVRKGYLIGQKPSLPWCHILGNHNFGTLLSDISLGFTWALNSRENKLTPWSNDTRRDFDGEKLLLTLDGQYYDIIKGSAAFFTKDKGEYLSAAGELECRVSVTVPGESMCKVIAVRVKNKAAYEIHCSLSYLVHSVLGDGLGNSRYLRFRQSENTAYAFTPYNRTFDGMLAVSSDGDCRFTFNEIDFFENKTTKEAVPESIIATRVIRLPARSDTTLTFYLSYAKKQTAADKMPYIPPKKRNANQIIIETPDRELNHLFNDFLPTQIIGGRILGRTGFYQCSGAYGFRDQLQDAMAVVLTHPELLKIQIFRCAAVQFEEGDVLHWFHPLFFGNKRVLRGVRTRYSDDLLWLPLGVAEYCLKTGDFSPLRAKIPYLSAPVLEPGETERFGEYTLSDKTDTLYAHCMKAFRHACAFGEHALPLMKCGDWNDSFNTVGILGKGESVWLAMFLSYTAGKFAAVSALLGDEKGRNNLLRLRDKMHKAVDETAWDGDHYLRCFYDDGTPMGKTGDDECEIDLLPQAWSIISGMPDKKRCAEAVRTAYRKLVDKENGIIKLFTPPFTLHGKKAGYVNRYPVGIRENGGQYSHGAVWLADAFFHLHEPETGYELLNILNPAKKDPALYKTEPYFLAGDVYGAPGMEGRGGWSLYTGSAGWFYRTVYEQMLGIRQLGGQIKINPCLPAGFGESRVTIVTENGTQQFTLPHCGDAPCNPPES